MKWKWLFIINYYYCTAAAQPFNFKNHSQKEGLSSNIVNSIVKDNKGFLWIGTANGLNRFDGNAFDVFTNNPADSTSIADNQIQKVFLSSNNSIWVSTNTGISQYNAVTQTFNNYAPDTFALPKIGQTFPALHEDADKNIWVAAYYDLLIFNPLTKKFKSAGWANFVAQVKPASGNHTRVLVLDVKKKSAAEFWVLTTYGLFSVHTKTLQFQFYPFTAITDYYGCAISYIDAEQNLWISSYNNGLLCYQPQTKQWKKYNPPAAITKHTGWNIVSGIQPYNNDTLLYCGNSSLVLFDKKTAIFSLLNTTGNQPGYTLPSADYYNIFKEDKIYWLFSNNGLVKMKPEKPLFTFTAITGFDGIEKIYPVQNMLLLNNLAKDIALYRPQNNSKQSISFFPPLANKALTAYKQVNINTAVISTDEKLFHLTLDNKTATAITLPNKIFAENNYTVRNVVVDKSGMWWVRLRKQGIAMYNPVSRQAQFAQFIKPAQNKEYGALYYDSTTNLLAAAVQSEGLYVYDVSTKITQHFFLNLPPYQKGATITCIIGDKNSNLYMSDAGYGFYVLNLLTKTVKRYTTNAGLISNSCNWLCFDNAGFLWLATNAGLSRFDTGKKMFTNFSTAQRLNGTADFLSADEKGNMYQPCKNGYYQWNSSSFINTDLPGQLYLRHAWLNNNFTVVDSVYHFSAIQNNIAFQFGYLQFDNAATVQFEYQLNNSGWITMTEQNKLSFSNLSPNKYLLQVRLKNSTAKNLSIQFTIHPPFYLRWWFIALAIIAAIVSATVFFKHRIKAVRRQAVLKQKIAETEMMALRAQMNPHFIFNCISSIDNFILDNDKENASNYLNKFAKLIRNILDNSKNDVIPFWKDWETLQLYLQLEQLRSNNKFTYTLQADEVLLNGHYKIPPLIIQPYIENAIHHGLKPLQYKQGQLTITAAIQNGMLQYHITDNGIGRQKAAENNFVKPQHQSYGMQLTKERIELFNQQQANSIVITDIKDSVANAAGTQVTVLLKI
jgi:ligand-binding sensor domain-containing protein